MLKKDKNKKKSAQTREKLYATAIRLFARDGFEKTTTRAIAKEAGVAAGAAYYYFDSKEAFVYEYYKRLHEDHADELSEFLAQEKSFEKRLAKVVRSKIEIAEPNKEIARALYRIAANPQSPLSPFSPESKELRLQALEIFAEVIQGAEDSFQPEFKKLLPNYLWMFQMGVILFWIYDQSKNSQKTFQFIERTVPLLAWMNQSMQQPLFGFVRKRFISILEEFNPDLESNNLETKK